MVRRVRSGRHTARWTWGGGPRGAQAWGVSGGMTKTPPSDTSKSTPAISIRRPPRSARPMTQLWWACRTKSGRTPRAVTVRTPPSPGSRPKRTVPLSAMCRSPAAGVGFSRLVACESQEKCLSPNLFSSKNTAVF
jgi:hypothetical protein